MNQKELNNFRVRSSVELDLLLNSVKGNVEKEQMCQNLGAVVQSIYIMLYNDAIKSDIDFDSFRSYLTDLLYEQVLTPIYEDGYWVLDTKSDGFERYHNIRRPSLLKLITEKPSRIKYIDTSRYVCIDINDPKKTWTGGIGGRILEEMVPLTFPYTPSTMPIKVFVERFLYHDDIPMEYDTLAVTHFKMPDGEIKEVYRFFKADYQRGCVLTRAVPEWVEITKTEYFNRKAKYENKINKKGCDNHEGK